MNIHYFQHVPFENLAVIEHWINQQGFHLSATKFYQNDLLPEVDDIDWLIIMGGPMSVKDEKEYPWLVQEKLFIEKCLQKDKKILGICLGAQMIADVLGSKIYNNQYKEIGWFPIQLTKHGLQSKLFHSASSSFKVFHWHGETFDLPKDSLLLASSEACENQAFLYKNNVLALQFHLEVLKESVIKLINNCADEIVDSQYIQTAAQMQADLSEIDNVNKIMFDLLTQFL